jgi:superfamily I DNA/RNA helicase
LKPEYIPYVADRYDINLTKPKDIKRVLKVLDTATNDRSYFDYTDMIYLPAIDNSIWFFPQDYVFVDEVQDLNRCQIKIIEKVLKHDRKTKKLTGRLIAVGDFFQGIYGFNAADEKSFEWFEKFPNTKVLPLSVSFRCSKNVILKAQEIVPEIKALDNAPDGLVREGHVLEEAESGDFVVCRTTMPLVKLFFEFLTQHKKAIIKGSDVGIQLIELIGKINNLEKLKSFWEGELSKFRQDLKSTGILNPLEHSGYSALEDKVMTLLFLSRLANSIDDLKLKIRTIFTDEIEGICLSTVHKVKGLEANRVFIVRPDLLPMPNTRSWQYIQEKNLEYVAYTRSRFELIFDKTWTDE